MPPFDKRYKWSIMNCTDCAIEIPPNTHENYVSIFWVIGDILYNNTLVNLNVCILIPLYSMVTYFHMKLN